MTIEEQPQVDNHPEPGIESVSNQEPEDRKCDVEEGPNEEALAGKTDKRADIEPSSPIDECNKSEEPVVEQKLEEMKNNDVCLDVNGENRKFSVVSFREVCELYEIDLEKGERDRQVIRSKPSALQSIRYYVMLLALISPFVTTYSRTIINFAITDMIDPRFTQKQAETQTLINITLEANKLREFDIDNSCPVDDQLRQRLNEQDSKDTKRAQTSSGEKFEWDSFSQGLLKGAYSYGHALFQIPGSRLSEIYGSHLIISLNALLIGACCLAAPFLASISFYLIFIDLMLLGILGSFMTPAALTLLSNWLTPGEKSLMVSFILVGSRLGYALSSFLCGQLLQADISWRYVFYSSGWTGLAFGLAFFLLARSRPIDHPLVTQLELDYLATKNTLVRESLEEEQMQRRLELQQVVASREKVEFSHRDTGKRSEAKSSDRASKRPAARAPWLALITNTPLWAFVVTKFCVKLAGDTAQIELPSYLKRVMHYSAADNGKVNAWNYIIFCIGCLLIGILAKYVVKERPFGLSKTTIRKLFQSVASFGVSLMMMGVAFSVCDKLSTEIFLLTFFFITTFGMGGEAQSPLDLSERYSGTIHAIGSSLAISGAIEPTLVGYFLRGRSADKDQWKYVWLGASAVSFIGGLVYIIFAEAEVQPFDRILKEDKIESEVYQVPEKIPEHSGDGTEQVDDCKDDDKIPEIDKPEKILEEKSEPNGIRLNNVESDSMPEVEKKLDDTEDVTKSDS